METFWFIDTALKKATKGAKLIPGKIIKDKANPLCWEGEDCQRQIPWELRIENGYPNVFYDNDVNKYRCYYTSFLNKDILPADASVTQAYGAENGRLTAVLYAESSDGTHWIKPNLGIVDYGGSKANNIIAISTHGAGVFKDEDEADPAKRYKMISRDDRGPLNIYVAFSPDGIHFGDWIVAIESDSYPGDTHNFVIRDQKTKQYLLFTRKFAREMRVEARFVSDDFIHWREPAEVLCGIDADDQVYGMPVFTQDHLYWGLPEIFYAGDMANAHFDHVEVELAYSGDGLHWQRVAPGIPFIPNGAAGSYDAGCCYVSAPVRNGLDYEFYYMGSDETHYSLYGPRKTGLCRAKISKNRLAGVTAAQQDGAFTYQTYQLKLDPNGTYLCVDVLDKGSVLYEALDKQGNVLPGLDKEHCVPIMVTSNNAEIRWLGTDMPAEPVMLRFYCQNAVLYTISGNLELLSKHPL